MHRITIGQLAPHLLSSFAACLPAPQANKASAARLAEAQAAKAQAAAELAGAQQQLAGQAAALEQLQGQKAKLEAALKSAAAQATAQLAEQAQLAGVKRLCRDDGPNAPYKYYIMSCLFDESQLRLGRGDASVLA